MKCNYNLIKSDGSRGKYFPLLSSLFGNIEGSEIYNYIQSRPEGIFSSLRSKGFIFSEKGLSTELSLDNNSKVSLIKRNDPRALFIYNPELPVIQEEGKGKNKKMRYNMSRIDLDTQLPFGTIREAYYKSKGYEPKLLSKPGRNKELVTPETLVALINQPVTPLIQGEIGIVYTNELTLDNINWIEVNKMIPEVAEIASKFGIPIRYNKNLEKPLTEEIELIKNTDRIVWGHPATGKTTAKEQYGFLDFDIDFKPLVAEILGLSENRRSSVNINEWRKNNSEEDFKAAMRQVWEIAKNESKKQSKMLMVSDMLFLRENEKDFDKIINIPNNTFIQRASNRGDAIDSLETWKRNINQVLDNIKDKSKIITTDKYIGELLTNTNPLTNLKASSSTLKNGDLITNTSTKKSPLIKEYRKELDKYEGLTPFSIITLPRSKDVSIEELTIGDMLSEVDSINNNKVNARLEDPDYKKFLVNFTREIDPLLSKSPVSQEYIEQTLNRTAREGVSIVRQSQLTIDGEFSAGYYDAGTKTIYINEDLSSPVQLQVLLHESIHALTVEKIPEVYNEKRDGKFRELQQLQLVYEAVKDNPKYNGLFTDLREFVAQVFTNYELQQDLRKIGTQDISLDYSNRPLLGVVLSSVYSFFKRLFFNNTKDFNASKSLGETLYNINHIINNYQKVYDVNNVYNFEFSSRDDSDNSLDSLFDVIFDASDRVSPEVLRRIEAKTVEYVREGTRLVIKESDPDINRLTVEEDLNKGKGIVTLKDPIEDQIFEFQIGNDSELQGAYELAKNKAIELLQSRRQDLGGRLAAALNTGGTQETKEEQATKEKTLQSVGKAFRNNGEVFTKRIQMTPDMKYRTGFQTWNDFVKENPSMNIESINDPNIVVHKEVREGKNYYSIILTSIDNPASKTRKSFMKDFLDRNGKEWTADEAFRKGFTIEKNSKGRRQLLASLLMMKIKQVDPDAAVGQIKYFSVANTSTTGTGSLQELDISEGLANLEAFKRNEEVFEELPEDIKDLINQTELLDPIQYRQSYIQLVLDYYANPDLERKSDLFTDFTYDPASPTRDRKELIKSIDERLMELQKHIGRKNKRDKYVLEDLNDPIGREYLLLAQARAELKMNNYGFDSRQVNKGMQMDMYEAHAKNRKEYYNPYLTEANASMDKILASFKELFGVYRKNKNKYTKEFIDSWIKDKGQSMRNLAFNHTSIFYENLYQTTEVNSIDKHGRISNDKTIVNLMMLKDPNDKSLTAYEAKYITNVLNDIRSSARRLITNHIKTKSLKFKGSDLLLEEAVLLWEQSYMGVKVDHNGNILNWGGYLFTPGLKGGVVESMSKGEFKQGLKAEFDFLHDEYLDGHDNGSIDNKTTLGILSSFTLNGSEHAAYGRNSRLKNLGLISRDGELFLMDSKLNKNLSLDLQTSTDFYTAKILKQEKYPELQREYFTGKLLLLSQAITEGAKMKYELKAFEDLTRALVDNKVKDLKIGGIDKDISKIISTSTQLIGRTVLSGSFGSIYTAFTGATMTGFIAGLARKYGKRFPGIMTIGKATKFVLNPTNWEFVSDIMHVQQLHNSDEGKMIFNDNIKAGSDTFLGKLKGLPTGRNVMTPIGTGDYFVKSVMYVAQLMYDDIIQNYKYDNNGDLYYDLEAEKNNPSKNEYRKAEFEIYLAELESEGRYIREDGNPLVAYTYTMANNLKTISASLLGAFTDEEKDLLALEPLAKIAFQFKKFLLPKANMLYSRGYTNTAITYYKYNSEGVTEKQHVYSEGLLQTIWDLRNIISTADGFSKEEWTRITTNEAKRANLAFAGYSLALFAIAYMGYAMLDDDWKKKNPYHIYLKASIFDIVGYMNPVEYINAMTTPVSVVYAKRVANTLWKAITWDLEEAGDQAMKLTGISRTIQNFKQLSEYTPSRYLD